jgi:hypothetical protein
MGRVSEPCLPSPLTRKNAKESPVPHPASSGENLGYPKPWGSRILVDKWGGDPTIEADQE